MKKELLWNYAKFRNSGCSPVESIRSARILLEWKELESDGLVRIQAEEELDNYFDVFGEPDTDKERERMEYFLERWGCFWVYTEYQCGQCGNYEHADSIGMCVYENPVDPFQNCYVVDLMRSAIDKFHQEEVRHD